MLFNRCRYPLQPKHAAVCGCKPAAFGISDARKRPIISTRVVGSQPDSQAAPVAANDETPSADQIKPARRRYATYDQYKEKRVKKYQETYDSLPPEEVARRNKIAVANAGKVPWNKGRKHSPEVLEKIRQRTREAMQRKEVVEKTKLNRPPNVMTPERKARISASTKLTKSQQKPLEKAAEKEKRAERQREKWKDPAYREMVMARLQTPEVIAKRNAAISEAYAKRKEAKEGRPMTPEERAKRAETQRRKWQDPEYRERIMARINSPEAIARRTAAVAARKAAEEAAKAAEESKPKTLRKTTAAGKPTAAKPRRVTKRELEAQAAQQAKQAQAQRRVLEETHQKLVNTQKLVSKVESMAEELRSRAKLLINDRKQYDAVMMNLARTEDLLKSAYVEVARLEIITKSVQWDQAGRIVHIGPGPAPAPSPAQPDSPPAGQGPSLSDAAPTPQGRSVIEASSSLNISSIRPHMTDLDYQGGSSRRVDELSPRGGSWSEHDGSYTAAAASMNGSHAPLGSLANGTHAQNGSQQADHVNGHVYTSNGTNGTTYDVGSVSLPSGGKRSMTARGSTADEEEEEGDENA